MRPWVSVAGTRCTRCTPDSHFIEEYTASPARVMVASLMPALVAGADVEHLGLPAPLLGEAQVHLHHLFGEERRLVTARRRAELDDDVLLVVGVLGQQEQLELLFHLRPAGLEGRAAPRGPSP